MGLLERQSRERLVRAECIGGARDAAVKRVTGRDGKEPLGSLSPRGGVLVRSVSHHRTDFRASVSAARTEGERGTRPRGEENRVTSWRFVLGRKSDARCFARLTRQSPLAARGG